MSFVFIDIVLPKTVSVNLQQTSCNRRV